MVKNLVKKIDNNIKIQNVLISVSDKNGLETFIPALIEANPEVMIYSTGGTYNRIREILGGDPGNHLVKVAEYTGQPEMQGGLVKTLDFKLYLGILSETHNPIHQQDLEDRGAVPIDMVIVNLYPFEETIARADTTPEDARANIDIGGPSMVRAAAKNYLRVAVVVNSSDYELIAEELQNNAMISFETRAMLMKKAFSHTAKYDAAIVKYMENKTPMELKVNYEIVEEGE